jgi:hypothetical protein
MYRAIVVVAVLLFCGCGGQGDSKRAQASSVPTVVTSIVATASNSAVKSEPKPSEPLSDEGQIRVAASEYMLRNKLNYLTNYIVFVSLTNNEMQALAAKLPECRFRPIDKMVGGDDDKLRDIETRNVGLGLIVSGGKINTNEARAMVAARDIGSATLFECRLSRKPSEWIVISMSEEGVADGPAWGRPVRK